MLACFYLGYYKTLFLFHQVVGKLEAEGHLCAVLGPFVGVEEHLLLLYGDYLWIQPQDRGGTVFVAAATSVEHPPCLCLGHGGEDLGGAVGRTGAVGCTGAVHVHTFAANRIVGCYLGHGLLYP